MAALKTSNRKVLFTRIILLVISGLLVLTWFGNLYPYSESVASGSHNVARVVKYFQNLWLMKWFSDNNVALNKSPRVFCWILTQPKNYDRAIGVKETWLKRCDGYVFISSEDDDTLPARDAHVGEGRKILWGKTKFGFRYAYDFIDEYDWFLKADDDTYVIMENLKLLVRDYSPKHPWYFGHHFDALAPEGYMSGGAGYVLSQAALRKFVKEGLRESVCLVEKNSGPEDAIMGFCLHALNVTFGDSRDDSGHNQFFPFSPSKHMEPGHMQKNSWYTEYVKYPEKEETAVGADRTDCCSDSAISFHYVDNMYLMEYMLYHLRPHGIWSKS